MAIWSASSNETSQSSVAGFATKGRYGAFETIRDAASGGSSDKPAKSTAIPYRSVLEQLWIIEGLLAWQPTRNHIRPLGEGR